MASRPPHKKVHALCPWGASNWADCDEAVAHQWGRCKAIVGDKEPEPCSRWAADAEGYCSQHFIALREKDIRKARDAEKQLQLHQRIDAYIEWSRTHPSVWDSRKMAAGGGLEPPTSRVTVGGSTVELPRKGPHRLTELA